MEAPFLSHVYSSVQIYRQMVIYFFQIIIFDVIEVVPEPGQPLTKHKIKVSQNITIHLSMKRMAKLIF